MSRNRKDFKTFYRFDGNGRIIPGSNILKKGYKPEEGTWQESSPYECCAPGPTVSTNYWVTDRLLFVTGENPFEDLIESTVQSVIDSEGNTYRVSYLGQEFEQGITLNFFGVILKQDANGEKVWQVIVGNFLSEKPIFDLGLKILESGNLAVAAIYGNQPEGGDLWIDSFILSAEDGTVLSTAPGAVRPILPGGVAINQMYLREITEGGSDQTFVIQLAIEDENEDQYTHVILFNLLAPFISNSLTANFVDNVFDEQEQYWYGSQIAVGIENTEGVAYLYTISGQDTSGNYNSVINFLEIGPTFNPSLGSSFFLDTSADSEDGEIMYMSTNIEKLDGPSPISICGIHYDGKITKIVGELPLIEPAWRVGFIIGEEDYFDPLGIANDSLGNVFAVVRLDNFPGSIAFIKLSPDGVLDWAVKIDININFFEQNELRNGITISGEQLSIVAQNSIPRSIIGTGSAFKLGTNVKPKAGTYGEYTVSDLDVLVQVQPNPSIQPATPNSTTIGANSGGPISLEVTPDQELGPPELSFTVTNLQ